MLNSTLLPSITWVMKVGIKSRSGSFALILSLVLVFRNIKNTTSANCYYAVSPTSNSSLPSSGISSTMGKPKYNKYNKSSNWKQNKDYGDHNKEQYKFAPFEEGKNRKTFAAIKEKVIGAINQNNSELDDTGDSLRFMEIKCLKSLMPIREYSVNADAEVKKNENASLKTIWEEEIKSHVARKRDLEKGLRQAYLIVFNDWCTQSMKQKIQALPDFETTIRNDPIALLRNIEQLMHDSIRTSCRWRRWAIPFKRVLNFRMEPNEDALEYIKRFKQEVDNLKTVNGTRFTDYFIEAEDDYRKLTTEEEKETMKREAFNKRKKKQ